MPIERRKIIRPTVPKPNWDTIRRNIRQAAEKSLPKTQLPKPRP